jgi:hypothetical protein
MIFLSNFTDCGSMTNHSKLTSPYLRSILSQVAHIGGAGLASRFHRRVSNAALRGFFVRAVLLSCYDRVSETTARWASPMTGTPISLYPVTNNWRCWRQVYNLLHRTTIMNTSQNTCAQHSEPSPQHKTIQDLHQTFAELSFSYGMTGRELSFSSLMLLERDCRRLFILARSMRRSLDQSLPENAVSGQKEVAHG